MRAGHHQAVRDTWGKTLPPGVDLKFFVGGDKPPANMKDDEVFLPVPDGYWELHPKMLAIARYAAQEDYDFNLLCDTDTYIVLPKLMASGFDAYDFSGVCVNPGGAVFGKVYPTHVTQDYDNHQISPFYAYLSGGHGYILSKIATKIVAATPFEEYNSEDLVVGQILGPFIVSKEIKAEIMLNLKDITFHLACGYYGSGSPRLHPECMTNHHIETPRKDVIAALWAKHKEMTQ